jgi:hypothetical protein
MAVILFLGCHQEPRKFNLKKYDVSLLGCRYDCGEYYLGLLLHHQCNNIIRSSAYPGDRDQALAGIRLETLLDADNFKSPEGKGFSFHQKSTSLWGIKPTAGRP